jgi:arylsulfatase A-like enzyme
MRRCAALLALLPYMIGCEAGAEGPLTADGTVLHFDDHLAEATVIGSEVPTDLIQSVDWDDEDLLAEWGPYEGDGRADWLAGEPAIVGPGDGAMRISADERHRTGNGSLSSLITTPVDGWLAADWSHVLVRARTSDPLNGMGFVVGRASTIRLARGAPVITDGQVHTYRFEVPRRLSQLGPLEWIGIGFLTDVPGSLEILSVSAVPVRAAYARIGGTGVLPEWRGLYRRPTMFAHAPGRIEYRLRVPRGGRFDASLALPVPDQPITFRVTVSDGIGEELVAEAVVTDVETWAQLSADLSPWADQKVTLALEIASDPAGGIGLWGAPTVSGERTGDRPNVILYVIDGGGADFMSLYDYARRTTPNLERLAGEGVVFEYAHSNSAWTRPSTPSFLTSLHQSALGAGNWDSLPSGAITMAEHFHHAAYQTALFTSNHWSGIPSTGGRGLDVLRERWAEENSASSAELHNDFWNWRDAFPGGPWFVHFQTTDVHEPHFPVAPFAGLFVTPDRRRSFETWWEDLWDVLWRDDVNYMETGDVSGAFHTALSELGIDPRTFFSTQRDLYDETMTHQDHQIGRLVDSLKATGEWDNTILIITSDHGHPAGSYSRFGRELIDPPPEKWEGAMLDSYRSRVPLLIVAPGRLEAGRRVVERVSLIDLLPTVLELVGLPPPEIMQGQSLVPLMTGMEGWEPRPVILEQYQKDLASGLEWGHIEVIDGRWGASLEIYPDIPDSVDFRPDGPQRAARLHDPDVPRLLLYDVLEDPLATRNVNDEHPDLVAKYTQFLERQRVAHESVRQLIAPSEGQVELTAEQLETLRSLGYIQ